MHSTLIAPTELAPFALPTLPPIPRLGADETNLLGLLAYTFGSYERVTEVRAELEGIDLDCPTVVDELLS